MWFQLTDKITGENTVVASLSGYELDLYKVAKLDREPGEFDDVVEGKIVHNPTREADTLAGKTHIAEVHAQKRVEALLIKMGLTPPAEISLLLGEANDRKITLEAMADLVVAKSQGFVSLEKKRQRAGQIK